MCRDHDVDVGMPRLPTRALLLVSGLVLLVLGAAIDAVHGEGPTREAFGAIATAVPPSTFSLSPSRLGVALMIITGFLAFWDRVGRMDVSTQPLLRDVTRSSIDRVPEQWMGRVLAVAASWWQWILLFGLALIIVAGVGALLVAPEGSIHAPTPVAHWLAILFLGEALVLAGVASLCATLLGGGGLEGGPAPGTDRLEMPRTAVLTLGSTVIGLATALSQSMLWLGVAAGAGGDWVLRLAPVRTVGVAILSAGIVFTVANVAVRVGRQMRRIGPSFGTR